MPKNVEEVPRKIVRKELEKKPEQQAVKPTVKPARDLEKELKQAKEREEETLTKLKYLQAEFDNYRKHYDKERLEFVKFANVGLVGDLLTVLDEFERAIEAIGDEETRKGMALLQGNLLKVLKKHGLERIEAAGHKFDPYFHEVMLMQESEGDEGLVLSELQKGYKLNGKVIRSSKVVVSKARPENPGSASA
ncbi:MAG: nucleotide exchange factor GrpE [Candidatus Aenigmarchaeota archaeon]|nr:nucleotide exchange factor GrpE [Candidatus Aenigmarchaeota archaeon]